MIGFQSLKKLHGKFTSGYNISLFFTAKIVGSWFISPVLSGIISVLLYLVIRKFILKAKDPLKAGFISLPIIYGVTFFINIFSVVHDGPKCESIFDFTHILFILRNKRNHVNDLILYFYSAVYGQHSRMDLNRRQSLGWHTHSNFSSSVYCALAKAKNFNLMTEKTFLIFIGSVNF